MEGTGVFLHIFTYLLFLVFTTFLVYKYTKLYTPSNIDKSFTFIMILVTCALLRYYVSNPGLIKLFFATICVAALLLLVHRFIPFVVIGLMVVVAWAFTSYKWLMWEFCRHNSWRYDNMCSIGWMGQAILVTGLFTTWWIYKYRDQVYNHIVQALIIFPYFFGFLFLCSWWCLVSVSTFWMMQDTYTKADVLKYIPPQYSLGAEVIRNEWDIEKIPPSAYPVFFKPNQCTGEARGISPIDNIEQAREYLKIRNAERPERSTVMQHFHNTGGEAVIIYYRYPYFSKGYVKTCWLKVNKVYFTQYGLRDRIIKAVGGPADYMFYTRDKVPTPIRDDIAQSPDVIEALDKIARGIPGLTVCRFDVKYETEEDLKRGKFYVIEIDMPTFGDRREKEGASDASRGKSNFFLAMQQARTVALWFYIGFLNIVMGNAPGPIDSAIAVPKLVTIANLCDYHGSMSPVTPGIQ